MDWPQAGHSKRGYNSITYLQTLRLTGSLGSYAVKHSELVPLGDTD